MIGHGGGCDVRKSRKLNHLPIAVDRHPGIAGVAIDPNADVLVCRDGDLLGSQAELRVVERQGRRKSKR